MLLYNIFQFNYYACWCFVKSGHSNYNAAMNNLTHLIFFIAVAVEINGWLDTGCSAEQRWYSEGISQWDVRIDLTQKIAKLAWDNPSAPGQW